MNFIGKVYWTTTSQDQICCYDTTTEQFSHIVAYDPRLPKRASPRVRQDNVQARSTGSVYRNDAVVRYNYSDQPDIYVTGNVVGSAPQWGDQSDATYAESWMYFNGDWQDHYQRTITMVDMPPLSGYNDSPPHWDGGSVWIRAAKTVANSADVRVNFTLWNKGGGGEPVSVVAVSTGAVISSTTPTWYEIPLNNVVVDPGSAWLEGKLLLELGANADTSLPDPFATGVFVTPPVGTKGQVVRIYDAYIPAYVYNLDHYEYEDIYIGSNTLLSDGRVLSRVDPYQNPGAFGFAFDSALADPASTVFWKEPGGTGEPQAQYGMGVYDPDTDLTWFMWNEDVGNDYGYYLAAFDNEGNLVRRSCDANRFANPYTLSHSDGEYGNAILIDRWLYFTADYANVLHRYNLDTDEWQQAGTWYRSLVGYDEAVGLVFYNVKDWGDPRFDTYLPEDLLWLPSDYEDPDNSHGSWNIPSRASWPVPPELAQSSDLPDGFAGVARVLNGRVYFSGKPDWDQYGYDDVTGEPYGVGVRLMSMSLLDGTYEQEFELPYRMYLPDGSEANGHDNWYVDNRDGMLGLLLVATPMGLSGAQTGERSRFWK